MSEALEGDVGRSFTYENKEYWAKELDLESVPISFESLKDLKDTISSRRYTSYYPIISPQLKIKLTEITEA